MATDKTFSFIVENYRYIPFPEQKSDLSVVLCLVSGKGRNSDYKVLDYRTLSTTDVDNVSENMIF